MLAIKECLIREGVLNLNSPNPASSPSLSSLPPPYSHSHSRSSYPLYRNHFSFGSHLDMMAASTASAPKSVIDKSVNDLTSASPTAKTSCQIQQQHPSQLQLQHPQSELQEQQQQSLLKKQQNFKRYQGHHPHFHHHTAPAYYTDLHLRIHTPEVKDSLNENYQSVYRTPSKLVKDERQFPKSATATVDPPTIKSKSDKKPSAELGDVNPSSESSGSFFRGGGCIHPTSQRQKANNQHPTSSPNLENPVKGNSPQSTTTAHLGGVELPHTANADGSVVFACNNFKPRATSELVQPTPIPASPSTGRSSRNLQRFNNRRRAVRVRSESRPISALYDIICKEKGLDIGSSSTNDEDSSAQNSHDEKSSKSRRSHSRSQPKQSKASNSNIVMSSGGLGTSSGGDHAQHRSPVGLQQKKGSSDKYSSPNTVYINDLSDNDDDDDMNYPEGGSLRKNMRLRGSHKKATLLSDVHQSKSSSLPPGLKGLSSLNLSIENHNNYQKQRQTQSQNHHHHHPSSKVSQESFKSLHTSSASDNVLNANYSSSSATNPAASSSSAMKVVEPAQFHLSNMPPAPAHIQEESAPSASGAGTSAAIKQDPASVASPKAERFPRKYRRSRDEKPRRHTDGAIGLLASEQTKDDPVYHRQHHHDHVDNDDDDVGDQMQQRHHRHAHHHHQQFPHPHDLNGAGHDFHVLANAANAKRFITRPQRATSAGINGCGGIQPSDSSSSASNSPIPGHLSPPSIAAEDPVPSSHLQHQQQQEIPPSKSPTVTVKTENGFNPTVKDMTNSSGGGGSGKNSTTATITTINTNVSNLKIQIPFNDESKTAILASPTTADNCGTSTTSTAAAVAVATKAVEYPKAAATPPVISASCSSTTTTTTTTTATTTVLTTTSTTNCPALQQRHLMGHSSTTFATSAPQKSPSKLYYNYSFGTSNSCFSNHINSSNSNNNNYATPTASSVLKQRKQTANCLSPKYRKSPLSPLLITATNAPLFTTPMNTVSTTAPQSSPSHLATNLQPSPTFVQQLQHQPAVGKLSPAASPVLGVNTGSPMASLINSPLSPNSSSVHLVRTTKTTRLRAAALDKKKDDENRQQQRFTSPTSPKHQPATSPHHQQRLGPSSDNNSLSNKSPSGSESEHQKPMPSSSTSSSPINRSKKLVPSVSVSVKQNLNEMHCTASRSNSIRSNASSPKSPKQKAHSVECTVRVPSSPKAAQRQSTATTGPNFEDDIDDDFIEINDLPLDGAMQRPRCSTMYNETNERAKSGSSCLSQSNEFALELSPVHRSRNQDRSPRHNEDRDKSSKRKSNLNRSLNEEAIPDSDEAALRRRRRRELGMARALVPNDDPALKELLSSPLRAQPTSPSKPAIRNDLSYHMEMARRGLDLATTSSNLKSSQRRAQTASPKHVKASVSPPGSGKPQAPPRANRRCDTVAIGDLRKQRTDEVNRKFNERTRSDLAEIIKIVEFANERPEGSANAITDLTITMNRLRASQEREDSEEVHSSSSTGKHTTFHQEERIYYEPDPLEHSGPLNEEVKNRSKAGGILRSQRMLKAKSIERESSFEPTKLSPILRRKSTDDPLYSLSQTPNHIVSILKKKDHLSAGESSSASSNASPVTFSANVMDTPSKHKRAGILKKRSSLDESRYYSRSHSPDERSMFTKSARRNSLEETAANGNNIACSLVQGPQGILKQSSYDSFKSDSCPSAGGAAGGSGPESQHPHSILKKKDSTSTPSDGNQHVSKHVSISQAVILAAAELSANDAGENGFPDDLSYTPNNEEYDIKPILKLETANNDDTIKPPKPILKKKSSGDSDEHEIKPILKTSRKSSREEFEFDPFSESDNQEPLVKPILKTDSPSKRRSLGAIEADGHTSERDADSPLLLKSRTRSLERQDQTPVIDLGAALNAIATSQANTNELVATLTSSTSGGANISVSDRIRSMEKFLNNTAGNNTTVNTSWESPLQNDSNASVGSASAGGAGNMKILKPSVIRRDLYKDRYKTQPVTNDEMNFFKNNDSSTLYTSPAGSAFKPAKSLEGLAFVNITAHGNQSPNAPSSAFALTRSFTQPLHPLSHSLISPPQSSSSFKTGVTRKTPNRSSLHQLNDSTANLALSFTGDSDISGDSHSDQRIFDMSSLEPDVDMIENQEPKTPSNPDSSNASSTTSGGGIVRTNSVRARANMFQQLQEKTNSGTNLNREERTSPRRVPRRLSPSPVSLNASNDEPRTPNNPTSHPDEEIEPSSLPLSERLRFFSSLSESHNRNSGSFTRSPPANSIERCSSLSSYGNYFMPTTPRSSTSQSSASVTPTPMECNQLPPIFIDSPMILKRDQCNGKITSPNQSASNHQQHQMDNHASMQDFTDSREVIKADMVKTSPFLQVAKPVNANLIVTETTPTSILTPTMKRIKLKTIGKLMLPQNFLNNDRNNNTHSKENSLTEQTSSENESSQPPKKIGKIKSPFIENCNQVHQNKVQVSAKCIKLEQRPQSLALTSLENSAEHHAYTSNANKFFNNASSMLTNGHHHHHHNAEDSNTDSGKENVDTSSTSVTESVTPTTPVVEMRRKFTRKPISSQALNTSSSRQQLTTRSASLNGSQLSSPQIDDKYAKFFGIASAISGHDKTNSAQKSKMMPPPLPKQPPPKLTAETRARHEFLPELRHSHSEASPTLKLNRFSASGSSRMSCVIKLLKAYEEIVVTERELKQAPKEFENLLHNESIRTQQTVELEKIFSSIV